jgi:predicted lipoprotein with Yx(FWY)xxD motif
MAHRSWTTTARTLAAVCGLALALGVYGLGTGPAGAAAKSKPTVAIATVPGAGKILVDTSGKALYTLTDANGTAVACTGGCLSAWPPVMVTGKVKPPKGVKGLSKAADNQLTSKGLPLYLFAGDTAPKQANGEGINSFGGTWHVVQVKASKTAANTPATTSGGYSGY